MDEKNPMPGIWTGQGIQLTGLAILGAALWFAWSRLGEPSPVLFWCAALIPVIHQVFVWLAWRIELGSRGTSRAIGFPGYMAIFFVLFAGRFVSLAALSRVDGGSLGLAPAARIVIGALLTLPGLYAMFSVKRYFGLARAAGADHFDPRYRDLPLENRGIFRFTNNGMYLYAFLLFWAIPVGFDSAAGLAVAAFSHAYIWVHYFAAEKPDMAYLYGNR